MEKQGLNGGLWVVDTLETSASSLCGGLIINQQQPQGPEQSGRAFLGEASDAITSGGSVSAPEIFFFLLQSGH